MKKSGARVAACATLLWVGTAQAKPTAAENCEAGKIAAAGTYAKCLETAQHNLVLTGNATKYTTAIGKCAAAQQKAWTTLETKYGASCPASGDQEDVQTDISDFTTCMNDGLGGTASQCDPTTLQSSLTTCTGNLTTCEAQPPSKLLQTGQLTAYGPGSDGALQEGTPRSYTDNGDGTITDNKTGLMWEKKSSDGSIHDYNNRYTWSGASYGGTSVMDGTITSTFLATLNVGSGFAGHTDWRIPNRVELESIVNLQNVNPSVDAAFNTSCDAGCTVLTCSCTQSYYYWSSTTYQDYPTLAWYVFFGDGFVDGYFKSTNYYARAVRGGL